MCVSGSVSLEAPSWCQAVLGRKGKYDWQVKEKGRRQDTKIARQKDKLIVKFKTQKSVQYARVSSQVIWPGR